MMNERLDAPSESQGRRYPKLVTASALCAVAGVCAFFFVRAFFAARAVSLGAKLVCIGLVVSGAASFLLAGLMLLGDRKGRPLSRSKLLFPLIFTLGLAFSLLLPPLSGPDEPTHYVTAYYYSNLLLGKVSVLDKPALKTMGFVYYDMEYRAADARLIEESPAFGTEPGLYYQKLCEDMNARTAEEATVLARHPSVAYSVIGYLPSILGLTVGRLTRLGAVETAFLCRLLNLMLCSWLIAYAIRRAADGRRILLAVALFPMVLHLIGTLSPDGVMLAFCFCAYAEFARLCRAEQKLRLVSVLPFGLYCAVCTLLKGYCLPLCLAAFCVPHDRFTRSNAIPAALMALALSLAAVLIGNADAIRLALSGNAASYSGNSVSLGAVFQNPLPYLLLIVKSVLSDIPMLALTMTGYSLSGFSVQLPSYAYALSYLVLLLLSALPEKGDEKTRLPGALWLIPISLMALIPTYGAMLVWWTPQSSERILGVQGRYFLPVLPFALTALNNLSLRLPKIEGLIFFICLFLNVSALPLLLIGILS